MPATTSGFFPRGTVMGPGSRYVLSLPGIPCAPKTPMGAHSRETAPMENPGAHEGVEWLPPTTPPGSRRPQ
jgi:hypothetical protein